MQACNAGGGWGERTTRGCGGEGMSGEGKLQEERLFASLAGAVQASQEDGSAPTGTVRTIPKISEDSRMVRCPALSCQLPVSLTLPFRGRCLARARTFLPPFHLQSHMEQIGPGKTNLFFVCLRMWPRWFRHSHLRHGLCFPLRVATGFSTQESSV